MPQAANKTKESSYRHGEVMQSDACNQLTTNWQRSDKVHAKVFHGMRGQLGWRLARGTEREEG